MIPLKDVHRGGIIEVYSGWLTDDPQIWSSGSQKGVRITPIKGAMKSKIDFGPFFLEDDEDALGLKENEAEENISVLN